MPQQQLGIIIDGVLVGRAKSVSPIPEKYTILPANSAVEVDDYSEKNKLAVLTRRDRLAGFHRIPGKKTIDEDYNFKKLEAETLQVRDLIALIQQGAQHHVSGLGTRIRLLIAIGTPMPLLQLCAALLSEPLIVFTVPRPFRPPIFDVLPMDKNSFSYVNNRPVVKVAAWHMIDAFATLTHITLDKALSRCGIIRLGTIG